MSSPDKTIRKTSKRSQTHKKSSSSPAELERTTPKLLDDSPVTTRSSQASESVRVAAQSSARRRIDFSKLDIRALAATVKDGGEAYSVGELPKEIKRSTEAGKTRGSVSVSFNAIPARIRMTKGGSRYILFVDETGFVSVFVSAKKSGMLAEGNDVSSAEEAKQRAVYGKINYQPSSTSEDEMFIARDWNAKLSVENIKFDVMDNMIVPLSPQAINHTISEEQNNGAVFHLIVADLMKIEQDYDQKEMTISLMDYTGYGIVTFRNAPKTLSATDNNNDDIKGIVIAGLMSFTTLKTQIMEGIASHLDYEKCHVQPITSSYMYKHNARMKAISKELFQFPEPFLED